MIRILHESLMITGFVAAMMLIVESLNVQTRGRWQQWLSGSRMTQYAVAALLGVTPGCLGAFLVVTLYTHGAVSVGAVVAAMIATSGDEAFVLLALAPGAAVRLMAILLALGLAVGALVDLLVRKPATPAHCEALLLHEEDAAAPFTLERLKAQWRHCSASRGILTTALALFLLGVAAGELGPPEWNWIRVTLLLAGGISLWIAVTVTDHFLDEHLWKHVARWHVPRVFLWTFAALTATGPLTRLLADHPGAGANPWLLTAAAAVTGIIPESGPHLIFVTLYAEGAIPFAALLANSVVQDGHGMLPLLAHSARDFVRVKAINLAAGLAAGAIALALLR